MACDIGGSVEAQPRAVLDSSRSSLLFLTISMRGHARRPSETSGPAGRSPGGTRELLWKSPGRAEGGGVSQARHGDLPAVRIDIGNEWAWCGERRLALR